MKLFCFFKQDRNAVEFQFRYTAPKRLDKSRPTRYNPKSQEG